MRLTTHSIKASIIVYNFYADNNLQWRNSGQKTKKKALSTMKRTRLLSILEGAKFSGEFCVNFVTNSFALAKLFIRFHRNVQNVLLHMSSYQMDQNIHSLASTSCTETQKENKLHNIASLIIAFSVQTKYEAYGAFCSSSDQ